MKKLKIVNSVVVLIVMVVLFVHFYNRQELIIHFSVDDVSFEKNGYIDRSFLQTLICLHTIFGVNTTCYVYGDNFIELNEIQLQFLANQTIKVGYHSPSSAFKDSVDFKSFSQSFNQFILKCDFFNVPRTSTLRLHYFYANDSIVDFLRTNGVNTLLTADTPNRKSYNLSLGESALLEKSDTLIRNGITYRKTNVRLTNYPILSYPILSYPISYLVIFTHQWDMGIWCKIKLFLLFTQLHCLYSITYI